jgi:hypothetical protein
VITACIVHSQRCISRNLSRKTPVQTISWCAILRTEQTNALVDHWGYELWAAIHWSNSFWRTPAVCDTVKWWLFTKVWIYSHLTACCYSFVLHPVLLKIFKCAFWVIFLVTALGVFWWTNWCLHSCCVPKSVIFDNAPANCLDVDPLWPCWADCVSMIHWCGVGEKDDDEKKWEVLRII